MAKDEIFDVCVIGTGAGGGVMIQELTAAGFRVVALQRGPLLTPERLRRRRAQGDDPRRALLAGPARDLPARRRRRRPITGRFNATRRLRRRHHDALVGVVVALPARRLPRALARRRRSPARASPTGRSPTTRSSRSTRRPSGTSASPAARYAQPVRRAAQEGLPEPAASRARLEPALRARRREARLPSVPAAGRDQLAAVRRPPDMHVRRRLLRVRLPDRTPRRRRSRSASRRRRRPASSTSAPTSMAREITVGKDGRARSVRYLDERREGARGRGEADRRRRQRDRLVAPAADVEVGLVPAGARQLERARREEPHVPHRPGRRVPARRAGARLHGHSTVTPPSTTCTRATRSAASSAAA